MTNINDSQPDNTIYVVRNTQHTSQNVPFNRNNKIHLGELYRGSVRRSPQIGLPLFFVIITYLLKFTDREDFNKVGKKIAHYDFLFTVTGTTLPGTGMFLCAYVVERSTEES